MSTRNPSLAEITEAVTLLFRVADDDAVGKLEDAFVSAGVLFRCDGCRNNYPIDGSDDYCPIHYDDCGACQDGESHPHWMGQA